MARFAYRVWSYKQGEMVSLLIHLGDRLGLYEVLDGIGTVTAEDLARRTEPRGSHAGPAAGLVANEWSGIGHRCDRGAESVA